MIKKLLPVALICLLTGCHNTENPALNLSPDEKQTLSYIEARHQMKMRMMHDSLRIMALYHRNIEDKTSYEFSPYDELPK